MMIEAENLTKKYRRGANQTIMANWREIIASTFAFGKQNKSDSARDISALDNVSFQIAAGETVAVIGRNGSGKSTLLKILSQITRPSAGRARLYGTVGSLLEVGAGFNHELTGRENVFLNAAMLGLTHREIARRFDEIVAFADLAQFLDVPLKRYSSGMFMRLAFAVAAHVEPEILLLDEVLAVGDFEFQQRCRKKIRELARDGRTILLVSHDLPRAAEICRRAIWLDKGQIKLDGGAGEVTAAYAARNAAVATQCAWDISRPEYKSDGVALYAVRIVDENHCPLTEIDVTKKFGIEIEFEVFVRNHVVVPRVEFTNSTGAPLFWSFEVDSEWHRRERATGLHRATAWLPANFFAVGRIGINLAVYSLRPWTIHFEANDLLQIEIVNPENKLTARGDYEGIIPGELCPLLKWTSETI